MTQAASLPPSIPPNQLSLFGDAEAAVVLDQAVAGPVPRFDQPVSSGFDPLAEMTGLAGPKQKEN